MDIKKKPIEEIEKIDDYSNLTQLSELVSVSDDSLEIEFSNDQFSRIEKSQNQIKDS